MCSQNRNHHGSRFCKGKHDIVPQVMKKLLQNTTFASTACLWRCPQFICSTPLTSNSLSIPPTSPRICALSSPSGWLNWQLWWLLRPLPQHNGWAPTGDFDFPGKLSVCKRWKSNRADLGVLIHLIYHSWATTPCLIHSFPSGDDPFGNIRVWKSKQCITQSHRPARMTTIS